MFIVSFLAVKFSVPALVVSLSSFDLPLVKKDAIEDDLLGDFFVFSSKKDKFLDVFYRNQFFKIKGEGENDQGFRKKENLSFQL